MLRCKRTAYARKKDDERETFSRSETSNYRVGAAASNSRAGKEIVILRRRRDICGPAQCDRIRAVDH
jgi:hypothetical protein